MPVPHVEVFVEEDVVACKSGAFDWYPGLRFISRGADPVELGSESDVFVEFFDDHSMCWVHDTAQARPALGSNPRTVNPSAPRPRTPGLACHQLPGTPLPARCSP